MPGVGYGERFAAYGDESAGLLVLKHIHQPGQSDKPASPHLQPQSTTSSPILQLLSSALNWSPAMAPTQILLSGLHQCALKSASY